MYLDIILYPGRHIVNTKHKVHNVCKGDIKIILRKTFAEYSVFANHINADIIGIA